MYKALVKVWKIGEKASDQSANAQKPRRPQSANPVGDEGKGGAELVSVVVTAQTTGGLVKKVNLMLQAGMADDADMEGRAHPGEPEWAREGKFSL